MSDSSIKQITFDDAMDIVRDESVNREYRGDNGGMTGIVTMTDITDLTNNRVVFRKRHNLIVLRGRTFALEKLFNDTIDTYGVNDGVRPYISDLNRQVISFGIGKGGAPSSDPFSPYAPPPTGAAGVALATRVPFRLHDTVQSTSGDPLLYIPAGEIINYGGAEAITGQTTQFYYYLKHFDTRDPVWMFDEAQNTVYKQITMSITANDCRTSTSNWINELCLYIGRASGKDVRGGVAFSNPEMFSRITFPTEYLSGNKALEIVYNVYA
jgi:hypothetical protein